MSSWSCERLNTDHPWIPTKVHFALDCDQSRVILIDPTYQLEQRRGVLNQLFDLIVDRNLCLALQTLELSFDRLERSCSERFEVDYGPIDVVATTSLLVHVSSTLRISHERVRTFRFRSCSHSTRGSWIKASKTLMRQSWFDRSSFIVISHDTRKQPSTPVMPIADTMFCVNPNGTSSGTSSCLPYQRYYNKY